jgi:hypothetical protein
MMGSQLIYDLAEAAILENKLKVFLRSNGGNGGGQ